MKYNIQTIENPIEKVSKLRGVRYQWGDNQTAYTPGSFDSGIIAQDVKKVLPEKRFLEVLNEKSLIFD